MADMTPQGTQQYGIESGYERGDANVRGIVQGLLIILAGVFVVMAAMYGMFNFLNKRLITQENRTPIALTQVIVPPEPRLLPSPMTDEHDEAEAVAKAAGEDPARATEDGYPWDKRNLEIVDQYDEVNAYGSRQEVENGKAVTLQRIPIKQAMQKMAGTTGGGSPAIMSWQPEDPRIVAGEKGGQMNLDPGSKQQSADIYDHRVFWEAPDEKFTVISSGGTDLKSDYQKAPGELSR